MPRLFHANLFALGGARFFCSTYDLKPLALGRFRFPSSTCGIVIASTCPALGDIPLLEDSAQVSAVEGFVEEVLEHHAAVQAIVLKLVGHPGT